LTAKEILKKYPIGAKIIDAFGNITVINNHYLTTSKFKNCGTLVLGGAYIFDGKEKVWAIIVEN